MFTGSCQVGIPILSLFLNSGMNLRNYRPINESYSTGTCNEKLRWRLDELGELLQLWVGNNWKDLADFRKKVAVL